MTGTLVPAGRLRRIVATAIDAVLVPAATLLLVGLLGVVEHAEDFADTWWVLHVLLLAIASYLMLNGYLLWRRGQTLGKRLLGIAMVPAGATSTEARVPLWKLVLVRAWFFPTLYFPLLALAGAPWLALVPLIDQMLIFRRSRRCAHDWAAGTQVIRHID